MAQLIELRQRLRAIETIKKITHAMRLISISKHTRLKSKLVALETYTRQLHVLFEHLHTQAPTWTDPVFYPSKQMSRRTLYIIISSNKGLCGNFNSQLFEFLDRKHLQEQHNPVYYIMIGKQAVGYGKKLAGTMLVAQLPDISLAKIDGITRHCTSLIMHHAFSHVTIVSNKMKTFFKQEPRETQLIPYHHSTHQDPFEYAIEQPLETILPLVAQQCLHAKLYQLLYESLLSEQAARFLSMDTATRNATTLLEETQLQYNKLRQLKITKELIELISGA